MTAANKLWDRIMPQRTSRPSVAVSSGDSTCRWPGKRPALIVVDMTMTFVDTAYLSGFSPTGWPCVEANAKSLSSARVTGIPIFFTKGYHGLTYQAGSWGTGWLEVGGRAAPAVAGAYSSRGWDRGSAGASRRGDCHPQGRAAQRVPATRPSSRR